jgi:hypothetical protein
VATKTKNPHSGWVVAKEACVINVGARPLEYEKVEVRNERTGEVETIDNHNNIVDEGDEGVPYAFKAFQKVNAKHAAVEAAPELFVPLDELDDADREQVTP